MFSLDLKAALRSIFRNRITSVISILGLGIGLGCIISLAALTVHEKSFDKYIPGYQNVYRVILGESAQVSYPLSEVASKDYPEIKDFFRFFRAPSVQAKTSDNIILNESYFAFADPSIFRITGTNFISGGPARAVTEIAISEDAAMKYFGNNSPVGSVLPVRFTNAFEQLTISGVFKNFPDNSTLQPLIIADLRLTDRMSAQFQRFLGDFAYKPIDQLDWSRNEFLAYLVLEKNTDAAALASKFDRYKEFITNPQKEDLEFRLQNIADTYLHSGNLSGNYMLRQGNPAELIYYEIIALLILVISAANYVLLTRATVSEKMPELGTRKTFGASRAKIKRLIIIESNLVVLFSLIPASFVIDYGLDFINSTLGKTVSGHIFNNPFLWLIIILIIILTGTLTGWLIGMQYSKVPALELINGQKLNSGKRSSWKNSFLIFHFTIYIVLISGVLAFSRQIRYSMSAFSGIRPENILVADLTSDNLRNSFNTIKNEIDKIPGVMATAGGTLIPPFNIFLPVTLATTEGNKVRFDGLIMGEGMTDLLGMEIVDGAGFGPYKAGTVEVLINESAAKEHNVKAGEKLLVFTVRGILKDFNAHSLHSLIQPMVILQQNPEKMGLIAVKTDGKNDENVKKRMKMLFNQISPDDLFETEYLTDRIRGFYSNERNQMKIITVFAILAAVLSIMGLFGITLISIFRRTKEIGLRKVNGASIWEVLIMVNSDFLRWVFVSVVIAVPAAIYLIHKWLERFAYKAEMSWWIYALAGLSALIIALLTVSWQSLKAATDNPVEALRYE